MWEIVLCPKCGDRLEVNIHDLTSTLACTRCFEKFALPDDIRSRIEEKAGEEFALAGFNSETRLDSSFWIS